MSFAQISEEEHRSHHPDQFPPGQSAPGPGMAPGQSQGKSQGASMMQGMGKMMREMMRFPPKKDLYPDLMDLPSLSPEKRQALDRQAHDRMNQGMNLLSQGLTQVQRAAGNEDFSGMQGGVDLMREGLSLFDSGLATHRLLKEGKSPKEISLGWLREEMNLPSFDNHRQNGLFGVSPFHLFSMVFLIVFSAAVLLLYFLKMRRAALLLNRLGTPGIPSAGTPTAQIPPSGPSTPSSPPAISEVKASSPTIEPKPVAEIVPSERWTGKLKIASIFQETPSIKTFRLVHPEGGPLPFSFLPGQFLTLAVPVNGKPVKRSYTIVSSPTQQHFVELTIKREEKGLVSPVLHDQMQVGNLLDASGPGGVFTFTGKEADSLVLIGGGVGITPLMSIIRYLTDICWKGKVYLLYACRTPVDYLFQSELGQIQARNPNFQQFVTVTRAEGTGWSGLRGHFTKESIELCIPSIGSTRVHLCGPPPMMDQMKILLTVLGVGKESIKTENFGPAKQSGAKVLEERKVGDAVRTAVTVTFSRSGKTAFLAPNMTILEAAESVGVEIDNSCRSGTCGSCKVKLLSGQVAMEVEDALTPEDKSQRMILACQARSNANVVVEA